VKGKDGRVQYERENLKKGGFGRGGFIGEGLV